MAEHIVNLDDTNEALLEFCGMTCESIVIGKLVEFVALKREAEEKAVLTKLARLSVEDAAIVLADIDKKLVDAMKATVEEEIKEP